MSVRLTRRNLLMLGAASAAGSVFPNIMGRAAVSPERFGANEASGNDTEALVTALEFCRVEGGVLLLGSRPYYHEGNLVTQGVSIYGLGVRSELVALDPSASALIVQGRGVTVANFVKSSPRARKRGTRANGIIFERAVDFTMRDMEVIGSRGAGVVVRGGQYGEIGPRVRVRDTLADGVHLTSGARDVVVRNVECSNNGDDSFAVVSYREQGRICSDIQFVDCVSKHSRARGFAVVGGRSVGIVNGQAEYTAAAGFYFYGERSYDTYGVEDCYVAGGTLIDCVANEEMTGYSAITLGGRIGSDIENEQNFTRGCARCTLDNISINGLGKGAEFLISANFFTRDCVVRAKTSIPEPKGLYNRQIRNYGIGNTITLERV